MHSFNTIDRNVVILRQMQLAFYQLGEFTVISYQEWLENATTATISIPHNHIFVLKNLFDGISWNTLTRGEKLELGRQFKYCVMQNKIPLVAYYGKAQNNSAQYIKL